MIDSFLALNRPSEGARLSHAAQLGLGRTQFMKLVRAWKAHGTALSIAGARAPRQTPRIGWRALPPEAEHLMCETLEQLGPDVRPVDALAAVVDALSAAGLPLPNNSTVWRRLMAIRQARGKVSAAGDVIVAECRVKIPVLFERNLSIPSLLIAAHASTGRILSAMVLEDGDRDAAGLADAVGAAAAVHLVTIDQTYAGSFGSVKADVAQVTPGVARSMLSRAIGRSVDRLDLQFNRTTFAAGSLLRTVEDRALSRADARLAIEQAIRRHNSARGHDGDVTLF